MVDPLNPPPNQGQSPAGGGPSPDSNNPAPSNPAMATPGTIKPADLDLKQRPMTMQEKVFGIPKAEDPWWKALHLPVAIRRYRGTGPQLVLTRGGEVKAYSGDFIVTAGGFEFVLTTEQVLSLFPFIKVEELPEEEPITDPILRNEKLKQQIADLTADQKKVDTEAEVKKENEKLDKERKALEEARKKGLVPAERVVPEKTAAEKAADERAAALKVAAEKAAAEKK